MVSSVFGEQPSAAKWNQLGENDAGFKDGTNIDNGAILSTKLAEAFFRGRKQDITTNTAPTGLTVQFGWNFTTSTGISSAVKSVTFPTAFSSAPIVNIGELGNAGSSSDPTAITDFTSNTNERKVFHRSEAISTTGFQARSVTGDATNQANNYRYGFAWIAIGPV